MYLAVYFGYNEWILIKCDNLIELQKQIDIFVTNDSTEYLILKDITEQTILKLL